MQQEGVVEMEVEVKEVWKRQVLKGQGRWFQFQWAWVGVLPQVGLGFALAARKMEGWKVVWVTGI